MNIIEEYSARININYPLAYHAESSFLILKSSSKERWGSNWCVLSSNWENGYNGPGFYRLRLSSPKIGCSFEQKIQSLNNVHFCLERSWFDYEKFFYEWNPHGSGLFPVFGDNAMIAAWEIFIFAKEAWFSSQIASFRDSLFETLNPSLSVSQRISCIQSTQRFHCFSEVQELWTRGFLLPLKDQYLNWFEKFVNYERNKLLR
jgi:hypothetical protein